MAKKKHNNRTYKNVNIVQDFTIQDLYKAYYDCRRRKRNSRYAIEFEYNLESNMRKLYDELKSGEYKIGRSITFVVLIPKPREVWAASFRDRIVHHLVYNAIKDRFYNHFIKDTFSCIPERGTLHAARQVEKYAQAITNNYSKKAYYLKADLKNFFVTIDKDILCKLLLKKVPEAWLRGLIKKIVYHSPKKDVVVQSAKWKFNLLPPHKSLWNAKTGKGLPIGNLTSQFFSNVYLNELDQYVKHKLKCKYYCRYVDDFVILAESAQELNYFYKEIAKFIYENLMIEIHRDKKTINIVSNGIDFVGYTIKPNRFFLRKRTLRDIFRVVNRYRSEFYMLSENILEWLYYVFNSYLGMLQCVKGYNLRRKLCDMVTYPYFYAEKDFTSIKKAFNLKRLWEYTGEA